MCTRWVDLSRVERESEISTEIEHHARLRNSEPFEADSWFPMDLFFTLNRRVISPPVPPPPTVRI